MYKMNDKDNTLALARDFIKTARGYARYKHVDGYNEDDLIRRDKHYRKELVYLSETSIMKSLCKTKGFVKLIANRENRLIGAVIVAPNAVLLAHELALAVRSRVSLGELATMPHAVMSFGEAVQIAARRMMARKK